jgi:hypothetical protein
MYELDYQPERLDWNEYFVRYKESGEIKYFKEFLHFYESYLDRKVSQFIKRYELEDYRAEDLKQIFVTVLWDELQTYDSKMPLLQLIKYNVMAAWHDYVRIKEIRELEAECESKMSYFRENDRVVAERVHAICEG